MSYIALGRIGESLTYITIFSVVFGVPAISVGWVLQSVIVMIKDARSRRTERDA